MLAPAARGAARAIVPADSDSLEPFFSTAHMEIPRAQLQIIEGGSHTFFIEQAGEFNRIVTQFLATDFHG